MHNMLLANTMSGVCLNYLFNYSKTYLITSKRTQKALFSIAVMSFAYLISLLFPLCMSVCLSVCVSASVCVFPRTEVISQPIFKCDTWLNASWPNLGSYMHHLMNYTGWFKKNAPKVQTILFLCLLMYHYKNSHIDSIYNYKSRV